jgi:dolichol-phosphate mannosyltransferase
LANTAHAFFCDLDADGANQPSEILSLASVARREAADVVIASKYVPGAVVTGRPLLRRFASRGYSGGLRLVLGGGIRDFSNSFRVYRRDAASQVVQASLAYDTPTYLIEMLAVWLSHGLRVVEVPTQYHERRTGASKVIASDLLRGALGAVHVGLRYRLGAYR